MVCICATLTTSNWDAMRCRQMYNDEAGHAQSLAQQCQQANDATAAADSETRKALERVEAAKSEAREIKMANMRLVDELQQARQESKDLLIDNARCIPLFSPAEYSSIACRGHVVNLKMAACMVDELQ